MSLVSLKDIKKSYGATTVLEEAGFVLNPGDRAGLVGLNGCGKTTLLEIISGRLTPDSGSMAVSRGASVGYLTQLTDRDGGVTLLEEMLSTRPEVLRLKERLSVSAAHISELATAGDPGYERAMEEYGGLLEEFESSGGYAYENEVTGALIGLGFGRDEFGRPLSTLSGGERTRLALGKLLMAGHDVLLLDEPTNHLDIPAITWLEDFLCKSGLTVLIVSHDRYFLDRVATRILDLSGGKVEEYPGNFTRYREEKVKRNDARRKEYELARAKYEKEKEYINRMRAGVNSRQAKGREKRLDRFEMPDAPQHERRAMSLKFTGAGRTSDTVISVDGVFKSFAGNIVLDDVSFTLRRGERAGIVGANGSGKSTLLKIILGMQQPELGEASLGGNVQAGYYSQGLEGLDEDSTVLDELWSVDNMATEQEIRDMLGVFLFSGDDAAKRVGSLSGGEKGRLSIAKIVLAGANLLVLDEPTNHLDIASREALERAVSMFDGAVLAVSHDRYFLDGFAQKIFELKDGRLTEYWGNYTDYTAKRVEDEEEAATEASEGRRSWEERKQAQAIERKKEKEDERRARKIESIESEIEELDELLRKIEAELSDPAVCADYARVSELTAKYDGLKTRMDALYDTLEKELA